MIRRHLIGAASRSHPDKHPGNVYRTAACTWVPVGEMAMVRPADRDSYHYKGLATCGSVWACPLCAAKIQERRRQEVAAAVVHMQDQGKGACMISFTFPHRVDQPLSLLVRLQREALTYMRGWRRYIELTKAKAGFVGRIRALEVTHGANGWHPHTHELVFLRPDVPAAWLRDELAPLWLHACRKVGLFVPGRDNEADFLRYSVDVAGADNAVGNYLAKMDEGSWNVTHELTKSASKQGKRSGVHPFRLALEKTTAGLFLEYVTAMKGQQQLVWSRGLKKAVGVSEKSDEEIAQEDAAKVSDRIDVARKAWRVVLGNDARWELTDAARRGGITAVRSFLRVLGYSEHRR